MIRAAHRQKVKKEREAMNQRVLKHKKEMQKIESGRNAKQKETKKRIFSKSKKSSNKSKYD